MTDLSLFTGTPEDSLADRLRAAVQAEGIEALVKDAKAHVRTALADAVTAESERTGTQFTAKLDGWSAQWTDPDPKPQVTDVEKFGLWSEAGCTQRVEVLDVDRAVDLLHEIDAEWDHEVLASLGQRLGDCLRVVTEYVLPEDPFTPLIDSGRCKIVGDTDDGYQLIDVETGETVPGVTVTRAKPTLRLVPKGKAQRAKAKRDVAELLGLPPEVAGGDAA